MKQLMMDLVGVTEAAALASAAWIGRGTKHEADEAATEAMRAKLNQISMDATIVIGEGELDEAPMLYIGEKVGTGEGLKLDVAVDPLEGTSLVAKGQGNSITVIAVAPKGCLLHAPDMYMEKIAVGPKAAGKIDIDGPLIENLKIVAEANGKAMSDLKIAVLDRKRNQRYVQEIQEAGARIQLFSDGDVTYSIAAALEGTGIDMFVGIGGAPEGVVSAVALKCLGGDMQARLLPSNDEEYDRCLKMGLLHVEAPLRMEQLISSDQCIFAATGITESILLKGIEREPDQQTTHSFLAYGNEKRLHFIESVHKI